MTEQDFIIRNKKSWRELEVLLDDANADTDRLQELFVKVSGDLSYARTFFPNRSARIYLNGLLHRVFDGMRRNEKISLKDKIIHFYRRTLPQKVIRYRYAFILSLVIFLLSVFIGVFSTVYDIDFAREILGDGYVNHTLENIDKNDPMAVYKDENKSMMFLGITVNNIKVAFLTFVAGVFAALGTVYVLISNGIMVGTFQTFFYQKGLFTTSFLTIWIHGTIEIISIIIAGAAGMIMGSGLLFPKSYSRIASLRRTAIDGLIIILSVTPLFIVAGFLEGFVTRMTDLPAYVKLVIILVSLGLMIFLYIVHPYNYYRKGHYIAEEPELKTYDNLVSSETNSSFQKSIHEVLKCFGDLCVKVILPIIAIVGFAQYYILDNAVQLHWITKCLVWLTFGTLSIFWLAHIILKDDRSITDFMNKIKVNPIVVACIGILGMCGYLMFQSEYLRYALVLFPLSALSKGIVSSLEDDVYNVRDFFNDIKFNYNYIGSMFLDHLLVVVFYILILLAADSSMMGRIIEMLSWHQILDDPDSNRTFYGTLFSIFTMVMMSGFVIIYLNKRFRQHENVHNASDFHQRLDDIILEQKSLV